MYHRPQVVARASSGSLSDALSGPSPYCMASVPIPSTSSDTGSYTGSLKESPRSAPPSMTNSSVFGMPLKYISLVVLAVQNAALSIVMHYSRVSAPSSESYSPATAVLLTELVKGIVSFALALARVYKQQRRDPDGEPRSRMPWRIVLIASVNQLSGEILSADCWKLAIPALLYVVQNLLQFVAISNLPVATFQVAYQMKILTTAAFSVALLGKRLSASKWAALVSLAIGVGIVQIQSQATHSQAASAGGNADSSAHTMSPAKGFAAVLAACLTSGLAGVYFEKLLKQSRADLWVRNVQLSLFSLAPALLAALRQRAPLAHFGPWACATVATHACGGLATAVVVKHADSVVKGFATSLSVVLSALAAVVLFGFRVTPGFALGAGTVLAATAMYNRPERSSANGGVGEKGSLGSPVGTDAPIIGEASRRPSSFSNPSSIATALWFGGGNAGSARAAPSFPPQCSFGETAHTAKYAASPYGSPWPSRMPTPASTPPATISRKSLRAFEDRSEF
ncbi:nucleotide-sugar transporter-domain-containing protein [Schizophyllum fasciatum]